MNALDVQDRAAKPRSPRAWILGAFVIAVVGVAAACWWGYQNRVWLRDDYKDGYQAGEVYDRATRLQGCAGEVDDRFGVAITVSMPEDAAAFTIGCYDASRDRYRPEDVGSILFEFMGG